jgi:hypothetical protein
VFAVGSSTCTKAAHAGDTAEVARLVRLTQDKIAEEPAWVVPRA